MYIEKSSKGIKSPIKGLFYANSDPKTVTYKKQDCKKVILWCTAYLAVKLFDFFIIMSYILYNPLEMELPWVRNRRPSFKKGLFFYWYNSSLPN
jgi:hypothetical protein